MKKFSCFQKAETCQDIYQDRKGQASRNLNNNLTPDFVLNVLQISFSWFPLKLMMATELI